MNLAADKFPQVGHHKASNEKVFQTDWINKKKLYLVHNDDGSVTAKVVTRSFMQRFGGLFKAKPAENEDYSGNNYTILEEKTFSDVKTPRFQKEKLQLQHLVKNHASIQTLLKQIEHDFKSSPQPAEFQTSLPSTASIDDIDFDITDNAPVPSKASPQSPVMLTAQGIAAQHQRLQGLKTELEDLLVIIEEQNKSKELKAYETLNNSIEKIEGFIHATFTEIGALEQRLANPDISFEEFLAATKGIEKQRTTWNQETNAIKQAFQEDRLIRQELLSFEKELIPFSTAIKEAWMKHKKEWLAEFAPKKLSSSMDMEPRRLRMKEICEAIRQQCLEELNKTIANEQQLLKQAQLKSIAASVSPETLQALNLFKKTALNLRLQTWKRLENAEPAVTIKTLAARQKEIKKEKHNDLVWMKWLNEIPAQPGYLSRSLSYIAHPIDTVSRLLQKEVAASLQEQEMFDAVSLSYLQKALAQIEKAEEEASNASASIQAGINPAVAQKKLEQRREFLDFIIEARHLRAQDFVAQLKKSHSKLFSTDTHPQILTTAHATILNIVNQLTTGTLHQGIDAEWKQGRLSVAAHLKTLKHLETLESDYQKYSALIQTNREKLGSLTGQEKQDAIAALDIFSQSLATLDIGAPLEKISENVLKTYAENVSNLIDHIHAIFHREQEKVILKGHIGKDIDRSIHFLDSLFAQVGEIERFYSHELTEIKTLLNEKKSAILQLKTKNTLPPTRWFWYFEFKMSEKLEELSVSELTHYRERVQQELLEQNSHALSLHISPLANALKDLQKEYQELESHAKSLTTAFKFSPSTGFSNIPQYLRATQHHETLKTIKERQLNEIKSEKNLSEVRRRVQEDTKTLKSLSELSKNAKALSLAKQIAQLEDHPAEQNQAKQTYIEMLTTEMTAHSTEMNKKLEQLVSTPAIFDETIDFIHETKGDLLLKVDALPESLKAHAADWFPIGSSKKFAPANIAVEGLSLSDLKQYKAYLKETIATGAIRMSSIYDAYQQAKESDRILQEKIQAAKKQLDVLSRNDQLLTKKALEGVINKIEQDRAQEPDITQLGYVATVTRAVKNSLSSTLATINDYKHHIGQLVSTLDFATKEANKITLTIPQQLEQHPDEETMIALRERFYNQTLPFLNKAHQALDAYQKENFDIFAMYVPRESTMYQRASDILETQQKILKDFHTSYTPLSQIEIRQDNPEEDSWWMPAGGISTAHFMAIMGSALLLGKNIAPSNWMSPLTIGKVVLPLFAGFGIYKRSQKEDSKPPANAKRAKEESWASTAAYYTTAAAASYLSKSIVPLISAFPLRQATSVDQRAHVISAVKYGSLVGAAFYASSLAAAMEMPGYPCLPTPGLTGMNSYVALGGLASTLLPSAQKWLTKKFGNTGPTSLAVLPPKQMEKYARDVKRLEHVLLDNTALMIDTKYSIETLAIAHNKYEEAKKDALKRVDLLRSKDHHVEAYQLENAVYLTSIEVEKCKVGKGEFWRTPATSAESMEALLETLKTATKELDAGIEKWIVTKAPTPFTDQLEILIDYKKTHTSHVQAFEGMLTADAIPEPDLSKAINALKNKIITSIDTKHSEYHEELHNLKKALNELFTKYSIQAPTKRQVDRVVQREIDAFSRPQDTKFVTSEGRLWNTEKTVEEMSAEEIIKHRPEAISKDFIDESKKRIKAIFSYEEILAGHNAYKEAVDEAEQAKIDLEQEQRISHAGKLNDEIFEISEAVKTRARVSVYNSYELEQLGLFLEKQARTLRSKQADILAHHKLSPSEQIDQLDPDGPYVQKLVTSLRKEIEANLAEKKKKITEHTGNAQRILESLGSPKAWLKSIKDKLKDVQKNMEKAVEPLETTSKSYLGGWIGGSKSKVTLAKMSMQQLGTVHKNLKAASAPIEDTAEAYHLSRLQTQYDYYQSQITAIDKQLKTSRVDKKNREVAELETLKHTATTELQKHFDQADANVPTAINELILFLQGQTTELYEGLRKIQTEDPISIATHLQAEAVGSPKYNVLKKDLKEEVKKKIDAKTKEIKAYSKHFDTIQKSLDNLEGVRAGIPERWRQLLMKEVRDKQDLLADLAKGLPIVADGAVTGHKLFDTLDAKELLTYETLIEQLVGKADKIFKHLEERAQLKKIAAAITTWSSARVSLKYATTGVHDGEVQKKCLSHCLESNDHRIAAVCKDLNHLSDTDTLLKILDQTEASLTHAYKNKKFQMDKFEAWDPWSHLYHKEKANENPFEKNQDVAAHISHILSKQISLEGHDPQNQKTFRCLEDILKDGVIEITRQIEEAEYKKKMVAKDAHVNARALLAWQTTIDSLKANAAKLQSLEQEFMFREAAGVEQPLQVSKIKSFKELLAYSQEISKTLSKSLDDYNKTNDAQLVAMTLFAINNKDNNGAGAGDLDDIDIQPAPGGLPGPRPDDEKKFPDDGGQAPHQQSGHQAGHAAPGPGQIHGVHGGGAMPPQQHPGVFQAGPAPKPIQAAAPASSAANLKAAIDQFKVTINTLNTEVRKLQGRDQIDIPTMTPELFNLSPRIPKAIKEAFNQAFTEVQKEVESTKASLARFIGEPMEAKDAGIIPDDAGAARPNVPDAVRNKIRPLLNPRGRQSIQNWISYANELIQIPVDIAVEEQKAKNHDFFKEFTDTLTELIALTPKKESNSWIKGFTKSHAPFEQISDTLAHVHQKQAYLGNTQGLALADLDSFRHSIHKELKTLEATKQAIQALNTTIQQALLKASQDTTPEQIRHSSHLIAAIHEALHALDKQSLKVKTKNDLIAFAQEIKVAHDEIQKLILRAGKGHQVYAPQKAQSKQERHGTIEHLKAQLDAADEAGKRLKQAIENRAQHLTPKLSAKFHIHLHRVRAFVTPGSGATFEDTGLPVPSCDDPASLGDKFFADYKSGTEKAIAYAQKQMKEMEDALAVFDIQPKLVADDLKINQLKNSDGHKSLPYFYLDALDAAKTTLTTSLTVLQQNLDANVNGIKTFAEFLTKIKDIPEQYSTYQTRFREAQAAASNPKKCGLLHQLRQAARHPGILKDMHRGAICNQIQEWGVGKLVTVYHKHAATIEMYKKRFSSLGASPLIQLEGIIGNYQNSLNGKIGNLSQADLKQMEFDAIQQWTVDVLEVEDSIDTLGLDLGQGDAVLQEYQALTDDIILRLWKGLAPKHKDLYDKLHERLNVFHADLVKLIQLLEASKDFPYFWKQCSKALEALESSNEYVAAEAAMPADNKSQRAPKPKAQKQSNGPVCPYEVLGFKDKNATAEQIKKRLREKFLQWHPDKANQNDADEVEKYTERTKEIAWAKEQFIKLGIVSK